VLSGPDVILILKVAVAAVTPILIASLGCLVAGKYRWHGRLNIAFFALTLGVVLGLEVVIRFVDPRIFDYFTDADRRAMIWHLSFSIPSALLLPLMLFSGLTHRRRPHMLMGALFVICWAGTFVTGIFFLPN
jgi:hypothetical protein